MKIFKKINLYKIQLNLPVRDLFGLSNGDYISVIIYKKKEEKVKIRKRVMISLCNVYNYWIKLPLK